MTDKLSLPLKLVALAAAMASLAACNGKRDEDLTVGQRIDSAIASGQQQAKEARDDIKQGASELKQEAQNAGVAATANAQDAAITASVNAALARDPKLSALKIDVDTRDGHVRLQGMAPDAESRARASRLASEIRGVTGVDNNLEVEG